VDFNWNEEQKMLMDMVRKFFEKECPMTLVKKMMTEPEGQQIDLWEKMAELGLLGLLFEKRYGGGEAGFLELAAFLEETGRAMAPGPFFSSMVMAGLVLAETDNEALKAKLIPAVCSGEKILTLAVGEEDDLWEARYIQTRAERAGDDYLVTGRKMFVRDAHLADPILVAARAGDAEKAITVLAVDSTSPGIKITPLRTISGEKQCEVLFDRVKVPADQIVVQEDRGWAVIEKIRPRIIIARCAQMIGGMERVLDMTIRYAAEREQFGVPISSFQVIQHYCVDMLMDLEMSRYLTYEAAWRANEGLPLDKEASMAKALCSDAFIRIAEKSHQIHGGIGFTDEYDLHVYSKHAKGWELTLGNGFDHRAIVARELGL